MTEQTGEEMLEQAASQIAQLMEGDENESQLEMELDNPTDEEVAIEDEVEEEEALLEEEEEASEEVDDPYADLDDEERAEMERARKEGWRPMSEYKGDPKNWKDYKEFNKVGDRIVSNLHSKIDTLTEQTTKQRDVIDKLIKAQGTIIKQAQEEALAKLQEQRKEAIYAGDAEAVDALDAEIDNAKQKAAEAVVEDEPEAPKVDQAVSDFMEAEKDWFNQSNPDMVQYAIQMESIERQSFPNASSEEVMQSVKEAVARRFPGRVPTVEQKPAKRKQLRQSPVEGGGSAPMKKSGVRMSDLPPEVRQMADFFEKHHGISKKEYLKKVQEGMS